MSKVGKPLFGSNPRSLGEYIIYLQIIFNLLNENPKRYMLTRRNVINAIKNPLKAAKKVTSMLFGRYKLYPSHPGYCVICQTETTFVEYGPWLRDNYRCIKCKTKPRQRVFLTVLNQQYPHWRNLTIHESSPHLDFIKRQSTDYSASQYYPNLRPGEQVGEFTNEDLTRLTFPDETFDLLLTQDVFEHVLNPEPAFAEIARVLKPGGAHVFTMPWYPELEVTRIRAKEEAGELIYLEEKVFHGNPVSDEGSLVTRDWGRDFADIIYKSSGLVTTIHLIRDRYLGIDGKFLEVFVSRKSK